MLQRVARSEHGAGGLIGSRRDQKRSEAKCFAPEGGFECPHLIWNEQGLGGRIDGDAGGPKLSHSAAPAPAATAASSVPACNRLFVSGTACIVLELFGSTWPHYNCIGLHAAFYLACLARTRSCTTTQKPPHHAVEFGCRSQLSALQANLMTTSALSAVCLCMAGKRVCQHHACLLAVFFWLSLFSMPAGCSYYIVCLTLKARPRWNSWFKCTPTLRRSVSEG